MRAKGFASSLRRWTGAALVALAICWSPATANDLEAKGACRPQKDPTVAGVANALSVSNKALATTIALSADEYHGLQTCRDNRRMIVELDSAIVGLSAVIYRIGGDDRLTRCSQLYFASSKLEIPVNQLRCTADTGLKKHRAKGGLLVVSDGTHIVPVARLEYKAKAPVIAGDDIGVALNILDRSGDGEGFRFFEGTSVYYSLSNLRTNSWRVIANLSVLDFDPETDLETGLALGFLYKPSIASREATGNGFAISAAYGYNFMADDSGDGWYTLIGFGWNFKQAP